MLIKQIKLLKLLFFLCVNLFIALPGTASQLQVVDILNVMTYDIPPLSYEADRIVTGSTTKIVEAVLKKAGIKYFITPYPYSRSHAKVTSKENSMIYPVVRTLKNELDFKWIGPVADNSIYLFKRVNDKKIRIMSIPNIGDYKVGVVDNSPAHKYLIDQHVTASLTVEKTPSLIIKKLYNNQVDMVAGTEFGLIRNAEKLKLNHKNLKKVYRLIKNNGYYMGFNKYTSKELLDKVQSSFNQLLDNGKIDALKNSFKN